MPSRKSVEKINETIQEYRSVLQKLFPAVHPDQLKSLDREGLLNLLARTGLGAILPPPSPVTPGLDEKSPDISPDAVNLEQLQPMPADSDDVDTRNSSVRGIADDVNALSLSVKRPTSYLGISSVTAVLRVILWLDPEAQNFFTKTPDVTNAPSRETSLPPEPRVSSELLTLAVAGKSSSAWDEIPLINSYFNYIHPLAPLLDELDFRDNYMTHARSDERWMLLLNTVLALGSMTNSSHCDEGGHITYWTRAKQYLTVETLGSVHMETVQALVLLSGLYLHYIQQPNLANSLMGSALRLATALGLHRDYSEGVDPAKQDKAQHSIELRRRVWWSIFVLDAWAGYGLGRPSMGRMSHAISAKPPQEAINPTPQILSLIQENASFCVISTKMEDSLAHSPILADVERRALDNAFAEWYGSSSVQNNTPRALPGEPHGVCVIKNVLRWRYLLCRILIHRPVLLWAAMRKTAFLQLPEEKRHAILTCRELTSELVDDIALTWHVSRPCAMAGWHATWLLYQALMVPLLCLYADGSDEEWVQRDQNMVEIGLTAFIDLRPWSQTAGRSLEVVSRIYQASKRRFLPVVHNTETTHGLSYFQSAFPDQAQHVEGPLNFTMTDSPTQELYMNNMFDSLKWSNSWVEDSFPYNSAVINFDHDQGGFLGMNGTYDPFMPAIACEGQDDEVLTSYE